MFRSKKTLSLIMLLIVLILVNSCQLRPTSDFAQQALEASMQPVHPGIPGNQPFWNTYSKRFIYAPAFEFNKVAGADSYRFTITAMADSQTFVFTAEKPRASLTPIWDKLPADRFQLTVEAMEETTGQSIKIVGEREFLKSPPFQGVQNEPAFSYRESGYRNLHDLLHQPKIQYWLEHGQPDPDYPLWCHPTKIMSALVIGMIHYAEFFPEAEDRNQAVEVAEVVAAFLLNMTHPAGTPLEYWPATYWDGINRGEHPFFHNEIMTNSPAIAAEMLLDFYDFAKTEKYFTSAKRIADTYVKTQRSDGTWPQILNIETGQAVKHNLLIPTMVIELFDRLIEDYDLSKYAIPRQNAFEWCMTHPMKTYNWQAQFEDTRPQSQFKNLAREEPTEFARILFKASGRHPEYIELAKELIRFAEDQFVVWGANDPVLSYPWFKQDSKFNGTTRDGGYDWFIPCALEQYKFYTPIARSSQLMILAYLSAYKYTGEPIYHAKAVAFANALTQAQHYHGSGEIPTHLRKNLPELNWINNGVYPAITLIEKAVQLEKENLL